MQERVQKYLARAGVASRRKAEELLREGRVAVNNVRVTEPGTRVDPARDLVSVDGKVVSAREEHRHFLLYKPSGCVTTLSDPEGRRTAADYLRGVGERIFPVGRLDYDAEGRCSSRPTATWRSGSPTRATATRASTSPR